MKSYDRIDEIKTLQGMEKLSKKNVVNLLNNLLSYFHEVCELFS